MIEISDLSHRFDVRVLTAADIGEVLALYLENPQFFRFSEATATREQVIRDMRILPPDTDPSQKHFVGYFEGQKLVAVLDLIDGYPKADVAYIGLFMVRRALQGQGMGSSIIEEAMACLKRSDKRSVRLAIDKQNPQSSAFWRKNGFVPIREVDRNGWPIVEAECPI